MQRGLSEREGVEYFSFEILTSLTRVWCVVWLERGEGVRVKYFWFEILRKLNSKING